MRKIVFSTFATLLVLLASSQTALAGELQIEIDDIEVQPGGNYVLANVFAIHDNYFSAIELHFALIDGITFMAASPDDEEMNQYQPWPTGGIPGIIETTITWTPIYNTDHTNNEFKVIMKFDQNNSDGVIAYFPPGKTLLCRLALKADATFTGAPLHLNYAKTDYSDPSPGAPEANIAEVFDVDVCQIKVPATAIPLATIVAEGIDDTEYTVADDLAVVAKGENCVFVTDGQDNWIKVTAEGDVFTTLATMDYINAGTLIGTLSEHNCNQTLTVTEAPTEGTNEVTYETLEWDLMGGILPKTNSVIKLTGYWIENEGAFCGAPNGADGGGHSVTANFAWCEGEYEMIDGGLYTDVVSIVQLKAPWDNNESKIAADDELAFQNLVVYPTAIKNQVVGVESLNGDKNVATVQYVNVAGHVANTPFQGMNMVVTRYADGSIVTTKVIK